MEKKVENLLGRCRNGKMIFTTPRYNFLKGGNWKDGFSGVGSTGGDEKEFEIINKEMIDESKPAYTYRFNIVKGKALIVK